MAPPLEGWPTRAKDPHEKINPCLTDINRCLTDIFKIQPILADI